MTVALVSPSRINTVWRCGYVYLFRYTDFLQPGGLIIPPGTAAILGKSFHHSAEHNYRYKFESRQDAPLQDVLDAFSTQYEEQMKDDVFWTSKERSTGIEKVRGQVKDSGISVTEYYHKTCAPQVQPKIIETEVYMPIHYQDGLWRSDFGMHGFIDLVDENDIIVDYKTTGKAVADIKADHLRQLAYYTMMYRHEGERERGIRLDYVVKTKTPQVLPFQRTITPNVYNWALFMLHTALDTIKREAFLPNTESYLCSPDWCGYFNLCPAVAHRR